MNGNWPRTSRPMPWLIAGFLVMLFLIPFDGITFKVHLPMDLKLDRVLIAVMVVVLMAQKLTGGRPRAARRRTSVERAVLIYTAVAMLSIVFSIDRIFQLNELGYAEKTFSQWIGFVAFFFVVVASVRMEEFAAYAKFILFLTCLTAIGTLYEAHSGTNLFYKWSTTLFSPIATVIPAPTNIHDIEGRSIVVGPTAHGLAVTSLLTIALPFAILPMLNTPRMRARIGYIVMIGLIIAAGLATGRKTAFVAPAAAFIVLIAYNRRLLRWSPVMLLALIPVVHFADPGAIGTFKGILGTTTSSTSTQGRVSDYGAVAPDILSHMLFGSGYGVLNPDNYRWYRILDNEYLDQIFQVGIVGLISFLAIVVTAMTTAHRVIRRHGTDASLALAASAGCAAFGVVSATFDSVGFPQAPYAFFFVAALIVVAAVRQRQNDDQAQARPAPLVTFHAGDAAGWPNSVMAPRPRAGSSTQLSLQPLTVAPTRRRGGDGTTDALGVGVSRRLRRGRRDSANTRTAPRRLGTSHEGPDEP